MERQDTEAEEGIQLVINLGVWLAIIQVFAGPPQRHGYGLGQLVRVGVVRPIDESYENLEKHLRPVNRHQILRWLVGRHEIDLTGRELRCRSSWVDIGKAKELVPLGLVDEILCLAVICADRAERSAQCGANTSRGPEVLDGARLSASLVQLDDSVEVEDARHIERAGPGEGIEVSRAARQIGDPLGLGQVERVGLMA